MHLQDNQVEEEEEQGEEQTKNNYISHVHTHVVVLFCCCYQHGLQNLLLHSHHTCPAAAPLSKFSIIHKILLLKQGQASVSVWCSPHPHTTCPFTHHGVERLWNSTAGRQTLGYACFFHSKHTFSNMLGFVCSFLQRLRTASSIFHPHPESGPSRKKLGLHPALQGDPVTPPGQLGDLVPPVCPGSSPGVSFLWDVQTSCEASRRHPNHVAVLFIVFIYHLSVIMYFLD